MYFTVTKELAEAGYEAIKEKASKQLDPKDKVWADKMVDRTKAVIETAMSMVMRSGGEQEVWINEC